MKPLPDLKPPVYLITVRFEHGTTEKYSGYTLESKKRDYILVSEGGTETIYIPKANVRYLCAERRP